MEHVTVAIGAWENDDSSFHGAKSDNSEQDKNGDERCEGGNEDEDRRLDGKKDDCFPGVVIHPAPQAISIA
jgi:hypothetical protein